VERIIQGRSATLRHTFYSGATPTDPVPDVATVAVTRESDGTVLVGPTVTDEGAGVVSTTLTPAHTALLDRLSVVWTATFAGQSQTFTDTVEVTGDVYFTIAEARAVKPLDNVTNYPDAKIVAARTRIEQRFEKILGYACVPRYERGAVSSYGNGPVRLRPFVRTVRSVSVAGVAYTSTELALLTNADGFLYNGTSSWPAGWSSVVVGYEHGKDNIDEDVKAAALLTAKVWLVAGPVDDRAASFSSVEGGTYGLVVPGRGGSTIGIPDVDAVLEQNRLVALA